MTAHRDEFTFIVALVGGHRFTFNVQDWDTDETPLSDDAVLGMANDLVRSGLTLYGTLSDLFPNCPTPPVATILDPSQIVSVFLVAHP